MHSLTSLTHVSIADTIDSIIPETNAVRAMNPRRLRTEEASVGLEKVRLSLESLISELLESHAKETRGAVLEVSGLLIHRNISPLRWYKPGSWISESMDLLHSGDEH